MTQWSLRHPLQAGRSASTRPTNCCAHVFAVCEPAQRASVRPWRLGLHDHDARHVLRQLGPLGHVIELWCDSRLLQHSTASVLAAYADALGTRSSAAHAQSASLRYCFDSHSAGATSNTDVPRAANPQHLARIASSFRFPTPAQRRPVQTFCLAIGTRLRKCRVTLAFQNRHLPKVSFLNSIPVFSHPLTPHAAPTSTQLTFSTRTSSPNSGIPTASTSRQPAAAAARVRDTRTADDPP